MLKKSFQKIIQIIFLALFIFIIANGKVQLWVRVFLSGIIASLLLGRIYCGWICPINTAIKGITWIKRKLHIKNIKIPRFIKKPWIRLIFLGLFIGIFIFTTRTDRKLPVLPALFALGTLITLFFPEELWHHYLCPYGTILSFPASKSLYQMKIDPEQCINCGICKNVCLGEAIEVKNSQHKINKNDCLICMECSKNCSQNAINYERSSKISSTS
ncbi:4Fe-4S binding protein [Schnuerera sp. xch1]|uniref:4Fe-4S binding protein n=1 Tax=Schnuerera sp. xch1 TaxID=2874283 RepID=UPI001CBD6D81|nr:4Fe-4S binding protein [Schnuerera sp. xch1]MBZ2174253.1 4Fe-4S binding protein [Schnuerera sp. xch1]